MNDLTAADVARFWSKVRKTRGCWHWTGTITDQGYGVLSVRHRNRAAHRIAYWLEHGELPSRPLDHTCHDYRRCAGGPTCPHRACVRPSHLEPVTVLENVRRSNGPAAKNGRKARCPKGHKLTGDNVRIEGHSRVCRKCRAETHRDRRQANPRPVILCGAPSKWWPYAACTRHVLAEGERCHFHAVLSDEALDQIAAAVVE